MVGLAFFFPWWKVEKQTLVTGGIGKGIGERLVAGCLDTMLRYPYGLGVATERGEELVGAGIYVRDEKKRPTPPEKRSRHKGSMICNCCVAFRNISTVSVFLR